jgi:AraC-like DNA-binding protein/ligand-binding sensor protein
MSSYINFEDFVNLDTISNLVKLFFNMSGLVIDIIDKTGTIYKKYYKYEEESKYCQTIKDSKLGSKKCDDTCVMEIKKFEEKSKLKVYKCHAGVLNIIVPIFINKELVASLSVGQVLDSPPTERKFNNIIKNISGYGVDKIKLRETYFSMRSINKFELNNYVSLLKMIINYINEIEEKILFLNKNRQCSSFVGKAKKFIEDNYSQKISLDEVAKYCYLSKYYFVRLFKKEEGMLFSEYLNLYRITKAKKLLESNKNIAEICYMVGFNSLPHFHKTFKNIVGMTPRNYRDKFNSSQKNIMAKNL